MWRQELRLLNLARGPLYGLSLQEHLGLGLSKLLSDRLYDVQSGRLHLLKNFQESCPTHHTAYAHSRRTRDQAMSHTMMPMM